MRIPMRLVAVFIFACVLARAGDHSKIDVLHMKNGDRITCEIKNLEHGVLTVKMDYTSSDVTIDWEKVERLESQQMFVLETGTGNYYSGVIASDKEKGDHIEVALGESKNEIAQHQIVTVEQLGKNYWGRMKGSIDYGLSFAKANNQTQSNLNLNLSSRSEKRYTTFAASSLFSTTSGIQTNRHSAETTLSNRIGHSSWSLAAIGTFLKSDQQNLDARFSAGGALQRRIIYTPRTSLIALGGAVYTHERYSNPEGPQKFNSLEGVIGVQHSTYGFDRLEWLNSFWVYPSITDQGRVRSTLDSSFYYKLIGNLYMRLGVYFNYDSRPPANTPKGDYGATTSVGWSF